MSGVPAIFSFSEEAEAEGYVIALLGSYIHIFGIFFVCGGGGGGVKLVPVKFIICNVSHIDSRVQTWPLRSKGLGILEKLKIPEAYKI